MSAITPVAASASSIASLVSTTAVNVGAHGGIQSNFSSLLASGLHSMQAKIERADELVRRFALDDSVPVHQVTYALEEARLSVELAMQVRGRLVEGYRDLMNMQL